MKREFDFLVNEPELNYLNQRAIHYEDVQGKGFKFYLIIQRSITYIMYVFKQFSIT